MVVTPAEEEEEEEEQQEQDEEEEEPRMESIRPESRSPGSEEQPEERVGQEREGEEQPAVTRSRSSSTSSEDYIIILPDCFDTSRPLGESMYSSALSQPGDLPAAKTPTDTEALPADHPDGEEDEAAEAGVAGASSANDMLCTSQTLDDEPLTPEVVAPPTAATALTPSAAESGAEAAGDEEEEEEEGATASAESSDLYQTQEGSDENQTPSAEAAEDPEDDNEEDPRHPGITSGLVKGALSVAASAYKALFTGQGPTQPPVDASTQDTMMAVLVEMGFGDRPLNQRLLKKHNYNLLDVVNELVQMTDNDWYSTRY